MVLDVLSGLTIILQRKRELVVVWLSVLYLFLMLPWVIIWYGSRCPLWFNNYLAEEKRAGCVVAVCSLSLPHGAVGWSAVCDCGISWSYPLPVK